MTTDEDYDDAIKRLAEYVRDRALALYAARKADGEVEWDSELWECFDDCYDELVDSLRTIQEQDGRK